MSDHISLSLVHSLSLSLSITLSLQWYCCLGRFPLYGFFLSALFPPSIRPLPSSPQYHASSSLLRGHRARVPRRERERGKMSSHYSPVLAATPGSFQDRTGYLPDFETGEKVPLYKRPKGLYIVIATPSTSFQRDYRVVCRQGSVKEGKLITSCFQETPELSEEQLPPPPYSPHPHLYVQACE